jgi:PAS domain S-box-containing protein
LGNRDEDDVVYGLLADADEALLLIDSEYRLVAWNRGAEQLYGYSADELLGRSMETVSEHELGWDRAVLERIGRGLERSGRVREVATARRKARGSRSRRSSPS